MTWGHGDKGRCKDTRTADQIEGARGQGDTVTRDACDAREGTRGQGDTGTRGEAKKTKTLKYYLVMKGRAEAWHQSL